MRYNTFNTYERKGVYLVGGRKAQQLEGCLGCHQWWCLQSHWISKLASRRTYCTPQQSREERIFVILASEPLQKREIKCNAQVPDRKNWHKFSHCWLAKVRKLRCSKHFCHRCFLNPYSGAYLLPGCMKLWFDCIPLF